MRMIPFFEHISYLCYLGCFTKIKCFLSQTPEYLEVLHRSPTLVVVLLRHECMQKLVYPDVLHVGISIGCILVPRWKRGKHVPPVQLCTSCTTMYILYKHVPPICYSFQFLIETNFMCTKYLSYHLIVCSHGTSVPIMDLYIISITKSSYL